MPTTDPTQTSLEPNAAPAIASRVQTSADATDRRPSAQAPIPTTPAIASAALAASLAGAPACPKCAGRMWDNRLTKRNKRAPDFKCRDPRCDGVLWPGQHTTPAPIITPPAREPSDAPKHDAATPSAAEAGAALIEGEPLAAGAEQSADATEALPATEPQPTKSELQAAARVALRQCYLDLTDFVLAEVRPKYQRARVPLTDSTAAAIAATLFIQTCRPRWEGGGV